jgi:15-cis-phytoene desaturase
MADKIAIFGGGIGGLSAAHELVGRGYEVTVYEPGRYGGKAANQETPVASPTPPRLPLTGEHGFRFFPGFYRHVIATMSEIPGHAPFASVADALRPSDQAAVAWQGQPLLTFPRRMVPPSPDLVRRLAGLAAGLEVTPEDLARMAWFRLKYATSCAARRVDYDDVNWWDFIEGDSPRYSEKFRLLEASIPRTMSAMVARRSSARVIGDVGLQMLFGCGRPNELPDRVLTGPTSEVWIAPWLDHLRALGVRFEAGALTGLDVASSGPPRIVGARVLPTGAASSVSVTADRYIAAVPVERMRALVASNAALKADTALDRLLSWPRPTASMVGAQFYLRADAAMVPGHVFYPETAWALTSISQAQFWAQGVGRVEDRYGDGTVRGILSVDISDWYTPGSTGKTALQCTDAAEVLDEVLRQLRTVLGDPAWLAPSNVVGAWLDDGVTFSPLGATNTTPLLVHDVGHMRYRPDCKVSFDNLYLASDYVKTHTLLATMEGANEAARAAVNALLDDTGSPHVRCAIWPLYEEPIFAAAKALDAERHADGRRHVMDAWPLNHALDAAGLIQLAAEALGTPTVSSLLRWLP